MVAQMIEIVVVAFDAGAIAKGWTAVGSRWPEAHRDVCAGVSATMIVANGRKLKAANIAVTQRLLRKYCCLPHAALVTAKRGKGEPQAGNSQHRTDDEQHQTRDEHAFIATLLRDECSHETGADGSHGDARNVARQHGPAMRATLEQHASQPAGCSGYFSFRSHRQKWPYERRQQMNISPRK